MTGYVKPDLDEFKVKELKLYNAYYCGICSNLSKKSGPFSRVVLNYEATFISILDDAFSSKDPSIGTSRCPLPPFRKKKIVMENEAVEVGTEMSKMTAKLKIEDARRDFRGLKKLLAFFPFPMGRPDPELSRRIKEHMDRIVFLELTESEKPDEVADAFGASVATVSKNYANLEKTGFFLNLIGRWVYLIDAVDDLGKDLRKKNYNPYIFKHGLNSGEDPDAVKKIREIEKTSVNFLMGRVQEEFLKLEKTMLRNSNLIANVVFYGMPKIASKVLDGRVEKGE